MAAKLPYFRFYPGDWLREVQGCSLAARGLWLSMKILMHDSERYGYLCQNDGAVIPPGTVANKCSTTLETYVTLLAELDLHGVPSRTKEGVIFSQQMVDEYKKREKSRKDGELGGNPRLIRGVNPLLIFDSDNDSESERGLGDAGERVRCPPKLDTSEFREAWAAWAEHREKIRKPLTWPMIRQQLKKMDRMGVARAVAMIEHTVEKGWWGLYESKEQPHLGNGTRPQNGAAQSKRDRIDEALARRIQQ
jgi:hypothetical protein